MSRRLFLISLIALSAAVAFGLNGSYLSKTIRTAEAASAPPGTEVAIFAGGCFWCVESDFDKVPGVVSTTSGYTGGPSVNPTYEEVSSGTTGHAEAVKIVFDPRQVSYERLLYVFWRSVDPVTKSAQFCDAGEQYRTAVFYTSEQQRRAAEASKLELEKSGRLKRPIVTQVAMAGPFYAAEDYHQNYYQTNSFRYNLYRFNCGRDARLQALWGAEAGGGSH